MRHTLQLLSTLAFVFWISGCATPPQPAQRITQQNADVYYGGMYLIAGTQKDIPARCPMLSKEINDAEAGPKFKAEIRDLIKKEKDSFSQISLLGFSGELAPDDAVIMACAFTGEKYFSEAAIIAGIGEKRNVMAYLGGALLLQHFKRGANDAADIQLLACYPFTLTRTELLKPGQGIQEAGGALLLGSELGLRSDSFQEIISGLAGRVAPVTGLGAKMQVRNIKIGEKARELVANKFGGNEKDFRQWFAGELGAKLSKHTGVPIIPFAEDTSTRNMAQMMENGMAFNIRLPDPDYAIDVEIIGFSRAKAQETASESAWVYAAYGKFKIVEAGSDRVLWEKDLKAGVPVKIAATQTEVDHSFKQISALLGLIDIMPKDLAVDKDARSILDACLK